MTQGLEGNKLAITSGFDKMDEVKKSDILQLPGYDAIEHPEMKETEEPELWISRNDLKLLLGGDKKDFTPEDENLEKITKEEYFEILSQNKLDNVKYGIKADINDPTKPILKVVEKVPSEDQKGVVLFGDVKCHGGERSRSPLLPSLVHFVALIRPHLSTRVARSIRQQQRFLYFEFQPFLETTSEPF